MNLIHETARRSERVDTAALSNAASYEIPGQMMETALFCMHVLKIASKILGQVSKGSGGVP